SPGHTWRDRFGPVVAETSYLWIQRRDPSAGVYVEIVIGINGFQVPWNVAITDFNLNADSLERLANELCIVLECLVEILIFLSQREAYAILLAWIAGCVKQLLSTFRIEVVLRHIVCSVKILQTGRNGPGCRFSQPIPNRIHQSLSVDRMRNGMTHF